MQKSAIAAMVASMVAGASATTIEQWDFTGNSLLGVNGTSMTFVNDVSNSDQTGGAFDDTYTVNRTASFSGNIMTGLNISSANTDLLTVSFTIASWDLTKSGNNGYWGIRLRQANNANVAHLRFAADGTGGTTIYLDGEFGQITDSASVNRNVATGGLVSSAQAGNSPLTVSLTLDLVNSGYLLESTSWFNQFTSQSSGTIAGLNTAVIDRFDWAWQSINDSPVTASPNGDFIELDQISITTTAVPEPSVFALAALGLGGLLLNRRRK